MFCYVIIFVYIKFCGAGYMWYKNLTFILKTQVTYNSKMADSTSIFASIFDLTWPRSINFMNRPRLGLGHITSVFALSTNFESGPWFAGIWRRIIIMQKKLTWSLVCLEIFNQQQPFYFLLILIFTKIWGSNFDESINSNCLNVWQIWH